MCLKNLSCVCGRYLEIIFGNAKYAYSLFKNMDTWDKFVCRLLNLQRTGVQFVSKVVNSFRQYYMSITEDLDTYREGLFRLNVNVFDFLGWHRSPWITGSLTHWLTRWLIDSLTPSLTHPLTDWLTDWLTHSLTHSLNWPPNPMETGYLFNWLTDTD